MTIKYANRCMPLYILINMRVYVEHIIYTLLNNQNVSLCDQESVGLIKESRYLCKF